MRGVPVGGEGSWVLRVASGTCAVCVCGLLIVPEISECASLSAPNATKVFLIASSLVRARERAKEIGRKSASRSGAIRV